MNTENTIDKRIVRLGLLALALVITAVAVAHIYQPVATQDLSAPVHKEKTQATGQYLELKEYGIKIPILKGMEDVTVKRIITTDYPVDYYGFNSPDVDAAIKTLGSKDDVLRCANGEWANYGTMSRFEKYPDGNDRPMRDETYVLGKYYIFYEHPQDVCTMNKQLQDVIIAKTKLIAAAADQATDLEGKELQRVQQGSIKGAILYPGEGLPLDLWTCAELTDGSKSYCQSAYSIEDSNQFYQLTVPTGDYYVYSVISKNPRDQKADRMYYAIGNEKRSTLIVTNGRHLDNVDVKSGN